ncbi:MAG: ArnT family glycosyltransferase [Chloroflexia bacterium]
MEAQPTIAVTRPAAFAWNLAAVAGLLAAVGGMFAWLLARFPYDGLYGQDAYAYYYEALALWRDLTGQPQPPGALFTSNGFYHWPIGYHLHIMLGFLLGGTGPEGGRAVTIGMAVLVPVLVYALVGLLWPSAALRPRIVAGLLAGGAVALTGTYARFGLSLMSDVPALFWTLLGVYCVLRIAYCVSHVAVNAWSFAAGLCLGVAVLIRFGAGLIAVPLLLYVALARREATSNPQSAIRNSHFAWAAVGLALALLPQVAYLLTHGGTQGYGEWISGWNPANMLNADFAQSNLVFFVFRPLWDSTTGFLSLYTLPAVALGVWALVRQGNRPALALLSWWLVPALFFSGTPYQAQRFVLAYLPALAIALGIGGATALEWGLGFAGRSSAPRKWRLRVIAGLVILGLGVGAWKDQRSARDWVATHAGFNVEERKVVALARQASAGVSGPPRAVCFGITAALYHYTQWRVADLSLQDEAGLTTFLSAPGPHLLVVPESSLATQWAGTPLAGLRQWLGVHYALTKQGTAGSYTVYRIGERQ